MIPRVASEPICIASVLPSAESRGSVYQRAARMRPRKQAEVEGSSSCDLFRPLRDPVVVSLGVAEIQQILQGQGSSTPKTTFFGVSPPTRATGVANPLVQSQEWRSNARKASHSNLEILKDIDSHGVPFLRNTSFGDCRVLLETPESGSGLLSGASSVECEADDVFGFQEQDRDSPASCQSHF